MQKFNYRVETLHSLCYFVKEIAQDSQVNMSLSTVKRLKSIIFIYRQKILSFYGKVFFQGSFLCTGAFCCCASL